MKQLFHQKNYLIVKSILCTTRENQRRINEYKEKNPDATAEEHCIKCSLIKKTHQKQQTLQ